MKKYDTDGPVVDKEPKTVRFEENEKAEESSIEYSAPQQEQINNEYSRKIRVLEYLSFNDVQLAFWMNIKNKKVWIKFWFEKFNNRQRVALWNKLKFSEEYYKELERNNPKRDYSSIKDLFDIEGVLY